MGSDQINGCKNNTSAFIKLLIHSLLANTLIQFTPHPLLSLFWIWPSIKGTSPFHIKYFKAVQHIPISHKLIRVYRSPPKFLFLKKYHPWSCNIKLLQMIPYVLAPLWYSEPSTGFHNRLSLLQKKFQPCSIESIIFLCLLSVTLVSSK